MSFYFTQLLAASGVRVAGKLPPPPLKAGALAPPPDPVEISGETFVGSSIAPAPPPVPPAREVSVERIIVEPSSVKGAESLRTERHESPEPPQSGPPQETVHIEMVGRSEAAQPSTREATPTAPSRAHETHAPDPQPAGRKDASEITPRKIFDAVINWIAAGETRPRNVIAPAEAASSPAVQKSVLASPPAPAPPIPERVIMKSDAIPVPAPDRVVEIGDALTRGLPENFHKPDATPPSITIGAIHLRIDPPPTPSKPARPTTPVRSRPPPPSLSAGWLKLRRHYVLPH